MDTSVFCCSFAHSTAIFSSTASVSENSMALLILGVTEAVHTHTKYQGDSLGV